MLRVKLIFLALAVNVQAVEITNGCCSGISIPIWPGRSKETTHEGQTGNKENEIQFPRPAPTKPEFPFMDNISPLPPVENQGEIVLLPVYEKSRLIPLQSEHELQYKHKVSPYYETNEPILELSSTRRTHIGLFENAPIKTSTPANNNPSEIEIMVPEYEAARRVESEKENESSRNTTAELERPLSTLHKEEYQEDRQKAYVLIPAIRSTKRPDTRQKEYVVTLAKPEEWQKQYISVPVRMTTENPADRKEQFNSAPIRTTTENPKHRKEPFFSASIRATARYPKVEKEQIVSASPKTTTEYPALKQFVTAPMKTIAEYPEARKNQMILIPVETTPRYRETNKKQFVLTPIRRATEYPEDKPLTLAHGYPDVENKQPRVETTTEYSEIEKNLFVLSPVKPNHERQQIKARLFKLVPSPAPELERQYAEYVITEPPKSRLV